MSAFRNYAAESADSENQNVEAVEMPEDETATSELAEATAEHTELAAEDDVAEDLAGEQEQVEDLAEAVAQESAGLSPAAARLLSKSLTRILGAKTTNKIIATENYSSSRSRQEEAKQIALEGIKETLKQFWEAIKAQLKKFYSKAKTYLVKAFSAARKLKERAEKIQAKASDTTGTIEDKSFSFGQTKTIAVGGKYNDPKVVIDGLASVLGWMKENIKVQKTQQYESILDNVQTKLEQEIKSVGQTGTAGDLSQITAELNRAGTNNIAPLKTGTIEDRMKEQYAGGGMADVEISESLPGGKALISITVKATDDALEVAKSIKNSRLILANDKYSPREVTEGDVKTLTVSQVDSVCDNVIEIAEISYDYEKAWERMEKFQSKLERDVDSIVREVHSDNKDTSNATEERMVRTYAESFTASVRRRVSFETGMISYALNLGSAMLNYAERSLAQHKAK